MVSVTCDTCKKVFQRRQAEVMCNRRRGMRGTFCCRACWKASLSAARRGQTNPNWKGGRRLNEAGYVEIRVGGKRRLEHTHVMECHLGRPISKGEVVHHRNDDRQDNRLENLELMTISQHMRLHNPHGPRRTEQTATCRICGGTFQTRAARVTPNLRCSNEACRKEANRQYDRKHKEKKGPRPLVNVCCSICGKTFAGRPRKGAKVRTCSQACYREYQRQYCRAYHARNVAAS
jgi:hypothetical protein